MTVTNYTTFRKNLKEFLDGVNTKHEPLQVTRANGADVIVLSKDDYESLEETDYLLRSPKNAMRIRQAMEELDRGQGVERDLIEE